MEEKEETNGANSTEETTFHSKADQKEVFTIEPKEAEVPNLTFQFNPNTESIDNKKGMTSKITHRINGLIRKNKTRIKALIAVVCFLLYLAYVGYSMFYRFGDDGSWRLLIGTALCLLFITWKMLKASNVYKMISLSFRKISLPEKAKLIVKWVLYVSMVIFFGVYTAVSVLWTHPQNLISLVGIVVLILLLFLFSTNRTKINWHVVFWGMALQFLFGIIVIKTQFGKDVITYLSLRFMELNQHAESGAAFVFTEKYYKEFNFLFVAMPKVLFFCTILSVLNYLGLMQFIIRNIGGFLSFCLGSAPAESLAAAANIFLGASETAVIVKDYLADMPLSELFCVLTTGMASVGGVSMIVFIGYGVPAEYLLAANVMSAPAALAVAKISMPGSEKNEKSKKIKLGKISKARNMLDAISQGCETGLRLVTAIVVNVMIYISLLSLVNETLEWFGDRAGMANLSLELICSYMLWPIAYIMGVAATDCQTVASLLGIRAVTNSGIAYIQLVKYFQNKASFNEYQLLYNDTMTVGNDLFLPQWNKTLTDGILQDKTEVITSYALCGFSCIQVVGISLGAIGALAPTRKLDLMNMAVRSFFTSTMASLLTACVAGLLYQG